MQIMQLLLLLLFDVVCSCKLLMEVVHLHVTVRVIAHVTMRVIVMVVNRVTVQDTMPAMWSV